MATPAYQIRIRNRAGKVYEVGADETVLEALEGHGEVLPFGCRYGGCMTCAAKLIAGEVDQSEGVALKADQLAEGYVLLCVAYLKSDCVFDVGVASHDRLYRNPFKNPRGGGVAD